MKKLIFYSIIPLAVIILYYPAIFTYFSQDDFFHFKVSQTDGSITQFLNLFNFHPFAERGIAFYRPVFREALFNTFNNIFGLNPYPFRLLQFLLLFLNAYLTFYLVNKLFKNKKLSFFAAFFYAVSSAQVSPLYYLTGGVQVLGATAFLLTTLIFALKYSPFSLFTFVSFVLALASHELTAVIPFLILGLLFTSLPFKKALKKTWQTIPYFLVLLIYSYLEINVIGFSKGEQQYQAVFNLKTALNSYMWYTGWALGLPEMLVDFVFPGFKLNPALMKYWGNYYLIIFTSFFVSLLILLTGFVYLLIKNKQSFSTNKKIFLNKYFLFCIFWFLISLSPVILLPLHKSTQYLETGLPAFWAAVGFIIFSIYELSKQNLVKIGTLILIISLFILSAISATLQRNTYWAAERGKYAKQLINQLTSTYPALPKGVVIYFENDPNYPFIADQWGSSSKQAAFILNKEDAIRLIYKDPTIKVYYEDLTKPPSNIPQDKIIKIKAKIY